MKTINKTTKQKSHTSHKVTAAEEIFIGEVQSEFVSAASTSKDKFSSTKSFSPENETKVQPDKRNSQNGKRTSWRPRAGQADWSTGGGSQHI